MIRSIPPFRIGGAVLALSLAVGFLGTGLAALRLPQGVIAPQPLAEPEVPPEPQPDLRYMALRDPLLVGGADGNGRLALELGVAIDAADVARAQVFLRDMAGAVDAPLAEAVLRLMSEHQVATQGWASLRAALPEAMRDVLNDRLEAAGEGRPILEVLVMDFTAR